MQRVRANPLWSPENQRISPTISSLFPSSYLEIREDLKLANQRPGLLSPDQCEYRLQTWLSCISPSRHSADHSLASESLIDIFCIIFCCCWIYFVYYLFFWDHMLGAINNKDKYGPATWVTCPPIDSQSARENCFRWLWPDIILLLFITLLEEMFTVPRYYKSEGAGFL